MKHLLIFSFIIISLSSCSVQSGKSVTNANALRNTQWFLQNDGTTEQGLDNQPITLQFELTDRNNFRVFGYAGCNNFTGDYSADGGYMAVDNLATTKMACPNLKAEQQFLALLKKSNRYEIKGNQLKLYKNNLLLLQLKK